MPVVTPESPTLTAVFGLHTGAWLHVLASYGYDVKPHGQTDAQRNTVRRIIESRPDLFLWLLRPWPDLYASFCAAFTCQHNVSLLTHIVEVSSHTSHDLVSSFSQLLFRRFQQQNLYPRMFPRAPETSTTAFLSLLSSHTSKISSCPAPQPVVSLLTNLSFPSAFCCTHYIFI